MLPPGADTVVVRYGDASVKSQPVQSAMEDKLIECLQAKLDARDIPGQVERRWTRPLIRTTEPDTATVAATNTFGVTTASPARSVSPALDSIVDAVAKTAKRVYDDPTATFAIKARRAGDHPFDSDDVEEEAGAGVFDAVNFTPTVDLDDPEIIFGVEVRDAEAFVYLERRAGPGGLPLGTQAPLVTLVSGGIDSPVAAYQAMRRGSSVVPVYVDLGKYGGADHRARALETVRRLGQYAPQYDLSTWIIPGGDDVEFLVESMNRGRMLAWRRYTLAVGEAVADRVGAAGIVTGEALGQKSSQTARNLAVTSQATDLPVHRPLLAMDKPEITELAKTVGTFDDSTIRTGCSRLVPDQVETNASPAKLKAAEPDDLLDRAELAVEEAELIDPFEG